jgi:hypothetical protein
MSLRAWAGGCVKGENAFFESQDWGTNLDLLEPTPRRNPGLSPIKNLHYFFSTSLDQGCQIFLDTVYQSEIKYTKLPQHYQMVIKYAKWP